MEPDDPNTRWTDRDEAAFAAEALADDHPVRSAEVFKDLLLSDDPRFAALFEHTVTPESLEAWGDFGAARAFFKRELRMSLNEQREVGAEDVAYVRFVADEGAWIRPPGVSRPTLAVMTLIWRHDLPQSVASWWRVHRIDEGDRAPGPDSLPRAFGARLQAP